MTAHEIMIMAHQGQTRKFGADAGKPYFVHPARIGNQFDDPILRDAGYLHDVLEDTHITEDKLRELGVNEEVIEIVKAVTKRPGEKYFDFIMRIDSNMKAKLIKMADLRDNMSSIDEGSLKDKYRFALAFLNKDI